MNNRRTVLFNAGVIPLVALVLLATSCTEAWAQSSSLFGNPSRRRPLELRSHSWIYQAPTEPIPLKINDILTIIVDEKSQVISEGEIDRKKKAKLEAVLKDWVLLKNWTMYPDPQTAGDPKISGQWDNKIKSEATLETRDAMKFRIACRVVDIRPNGNLVIEGRRTIRNNHEIWEQAITGVIRSGDVMPNNTVLSENIAEMRVYKREAGQVRDGYRRGWMLKWLDSYQPF